MPTNTDHFLRLLKVELQDLVEDIQDLDEHLQHRLEDEEISEYGFKENDAFFRRELDSLTKFRNLVDGIKHGDYKDTGAMTSDLLGKLERSTAESGDPEAVLGLVSRKFRKLEDYLHN